MNQPHPMSKIGSSQVNEMVVTISGSVGMSGLIMVSDQFGQELEVSATLIAGIGLPLVGERWLATKRVGMWALDVCIENKPAPVIVGDKSAMDPVLVQLIDVLAQHGIVIDDTVGEVFDDYIVYGEENDPVLSLEDPIETDYLGMDDIPTEDDYIPDNDPWTDPNTQGDPDEGSDGPINQQDPKPPKDDDPDNENKDHPKDPTRKTSNFTMCTYNQWGGLGRERVTRDIQRLTKTRADVIVIQEAAAAERRDIYSNAIPDSWRMFRPAAPGGPATTRNTILWDSDVFRKISDGSIQLGPESPGPPPACYINWVRLTHKESGQTITVGDVHFDAWACFGGRYGSGKTKPDNIARHKIQMKNLGPALETLKAKGGPVFIGGDHNCNFRADSKIRAQGLPWQVYHSHKFRNIWEEVPPPGLGTIGRGGTLFDQIWACDNGAPNTVQGVWSKVLPGYYSDHRPVLATYRLKALSKPNKR